MAPMTETPDLPDEDRDPARPYLDYQGSLELNAAPRRGLPSAKAYVPHEDMPGYWKEVQRRCEAEIRAAADSPASDPAIAAALRAYYLEGEPDPLGAAAAFEVAAAITRLWTVSPHYRQFDAWILEHGTDFAACAVLEQTAVRVVGEQSGKPLALWLTDTRGESPAVQFAPALPAGEEWGRGPEATAVRTMLSAMPAVEYRHFRELFASMGRNHRQRLARAFMMPTERDWVEEVCAEWRDRDSRSRSAEEMLAATVFSFDQLTALGIDSLPNRSGHSDSIGSLVEAFGAASAPFLLACIPRIGREYQGVATMHEVLAGLPHDGAVEYMLRNMIAKRTFPLARDASQRFPRRSLRIIARIADEVDPPLRSRFTHLVETESLLGAALDVADAPVREAIDRLLRLDGVAPEAGELPEFLANPPWKRKGTKRKRLVVEMEPIDSDGLRWRDGERETWAEGGKTIDDAQQWLAESGDATEALAALAKATHHRALPPLKGVAAARLAADWLVRLRSTRVSVGDWLDRHGLDVVVWLAPDAIGKPGKPRKAAEAVLRDAARRHGDEAVLAATAPYGDDAVAAVGEILAADPLDLDGRKAPKIPEWVEPVLAMPVLVRGRNERLPRSAVEHIVDAMALDSLSIPYAGIEIVKELCDPASLTAFSWAVFESWEISEAPAKDAWALTQLARFADLDTVERLEALIRAWPDQRLSKRALTGLEVLGAVESEDALRAVHRLTGFRDSKAVKAAAVNQVELIAAGMGLDAEQLADRLVPDLGLRDGETVELDYGPRRFTVGFDERLRPFVIGENGKILRDLPKPAVDDDAEAAETAGRRFRRLKQGLESVATEQVRRLERAMVDGRTWSGVEFQRHLVGHPLLWRLVKRLVWQAETAAGTIAFRLAEDRTCADIEENAIELAADARIRLSHPVLLGDGLPEWVERLADYEVLQPFDQLTRPVFVPTAAESAAGRLTRFEGRKAKAGPLLGLTRGDWRAVRQESVATGLERRLRGGGAIRVRIAPGFGGGPYFDAEAVQVVEEVAFPGEAIDPVTIAEVIAALEKATKTG